MESWMQLAVALSFSWLGMVLAISFVEAPLKFRAPGITIPLGLGIGRLVFRALNAVETLLALAIAGCLVLGSPTTVPTVALGIAMAILVVQVLVVRPALTRRTDAVLAAPDGVTGPGSHAHLGYVGLEVLKVAALVTGGVALLGP